MKTSASSSPTTDARALIPKHPTLASLAAAAAQCRACPLWKCGTQTVFGLGPGKAQLVFVGEQPGDQEDLAGKPFVGPAGKLLDRALEESGVDRKTVYVTNAVKHFKWEPRGRRRIHKKPNTQEIAACRPWLEAELSVLTPKLVVALGATAAQTLLGPKFRVTQSRGELQKTATHSIVATVHPSSILRALGEDRDKEYQLFVNDLKRMRTIAADL